MVVLGRGGFRRFRCFAVANSDAGAFDGFVVPGVTFFQFGQDEVFFAGGCHEGFVDVWIEFLA